VSGDPRARLFVNLGTTGSPTVLEIAAELGKKDIGVLDAPISGGPQRARIGELLSIVSGDQQNLEFARPVIDSYSSRVVYLGPRLGAAQTMKLVNNLLVVSNMVLTTEAMVMGVKGGLDPEQMLDVLRSGTGQNYAATEIFPRFVFTRGFNFGGHLSMGAKDYDCVLDEAASLGVPVPAAEAVQQILLTAMEDQGANADFTTIVKFVEKRAQTLFPKTRP
jgi:3-hydroxyisobutyrate dehydrogenase-like beta-hydroxyacid dehydrogenase